MSESVELTQAKSRISNFVEELRNFPCAFNLGDAIVLDAGRRLDVKRPILKDDAWLFLTKHLREDDDDAELVNFMWKQNFLVRIHAELHNVRKALKLCKDLVQESPENLVACANLAFVYLLKGDMSMAEDQLQCIKAMDMTNDIRLDALAEQCYMYYKISGDDENLISGMELIKHVLRFRPHDDRLRLMMAVLYRRLSRFKKYRAEDQSAYRKGCVTRAVKELDKLRTAESSSQLVKAVANIELALLKNDTRLFDDSEKAGLMGEESVEDLCTLAITLSPTSTRVTTTAGQILMSMRNFAKAEDIFINVLKDKTCSRAYIYLGWVYANKAVELNIKSCWRGSSNTKHFQNNNFEKPRRLIQLLNDVTGNILYFNDDSDYTRQTLDIFKKCVDMGFCEAEMLRKIAFKFMQCRDYTTALNVCEQLSRQDRSYAQQTTCHSLVYHMAAMCCSQMAHTSQNENEKQTLYSKAEDMVLCSIRVMASLLLKGSHPISPRDLWRSFSRTPISRELMVDQCTEPHFETLCKLVAYYMTAVPILRDLVNKSEESWMDTQGLEDDLKFWETKGLTKAILYLDFIKLRGDTASQLTWQNSQVVRGIKLKAAERALRLHQADDQPDSIWQEIFNEEYVIDAASKWAPLSRLDALLELKTYDVVVVGTGEELTRQVVQCLKEILGQVCGMIAIDMAELPSLEQQMVVTCGATVVIFVTNVNTPRRSFDIIRQACLNSYDHGNSPKQILNLCIGPFSTHDHCKELIGHQRLFLTCNDLKDMSLMSPAVNRSESYFSDDILSSLTVCPSEDLALSSATSADEVPISDETEVSAHGTERSAHDTERSARGRQDSSIYTDDLNANSDESVEVVMKIFKGIVRQLPYDN